jgi:3-hydroxyacyl-CoA dehydrogenase
VKVAVAGAGTMGAGVAQCLAAAGHDVVLTDPDEAALAAAPGRIRAGQRLRALLRRPSPAAGEGDVRLARSLAGLGAPEFVIDCAPERQPLKEQLFRDLDRCCPAATILATCTSAIPVRVLAAATGRPDRVIGTHFMNPAPVKDTVEVIRPAAASDETLRRTLALLDSIGKRAIVVGDAPGFVSNRVLMLMVNQAAAVVHEGTAAAAAVDEIFEQCAGHAMGPLRTADLIGLDTIVDSLLVLREHTGSPAYEPSPLLLALVRDGRLGRKSGRGFHEYAAVPGG